jgi:prevent-host-death family protein
MKLSTNIKPISHLKAHTAAVVRQLMDEREPLVITQNGEAKVVMQDVRSFEETQETLALRSGVTRNVLIDVEHGKRGILYERLVDIAEALEVAPGILFDTPRLRPAD